MFKKIAISALSFHLIIVAPNFGDLTNGTGIFDGTLHEFTLMDDIKSKAPIINIKRTRNIMQRRDAGCDIVYKKLMGVDVRQITVDDLYAATKICKNEFYQGALRDWETDNDDVFLEKIEPFFNEANKLDTLSNAWFGDINRVDPGTYTWSLNKYDGIWKWVATYFAGGVIPVTQTMAMPVSDKRQIFADAYNVIKGLYDRQNLLMRSWAPTDKAFYVSQDIADGYGNYLRSLGNGDSNTIAMYANGVKIREYEGIPIIPEPCWEPILAEIHGAPGRSAAMLTIRGNMVLGTDKEYGEGPEKDALRVWYDDNELTFKYQQFMRLGTQIALPEHVCFAIS